MRQRIVAFVVATRVCETEGLTETAVKVKLQWRATGGGETADVSCECGNRVSSQQ